MANERFDQLDPSDLNRENNPEGSEVITPPHATLLNSSVSRRNTLKWAGRAGVGLLAVEGTISVVEKSLRLIHDTHPGVESTPHEIPFNSDPDIREIESRLGIRLVSLQEGLTYLGVQFDPKDTFNYGDSLPIRWDIGRAKLIDEILGYLPKHYHEPSIAGEPLIIALTNFGSNNLLGQFRQEVSHRLMLLDSDSVSRKNESGALDLTTHEGTHRLQALGYSHLDTILPQVFGKNITDVFQDTVTWLDKQSGDSLFIQNLRYGAENVLNDFDLTQVEDVGQTRIRKNTTEFEAVLSQFYVHGSDFFHKNLGEVYGDKADTLYAYMRDAIFRGTEYTVYPIEQKKREQFDSGVMIANDILSHLIKQDVIDQGLLFPKFDSSDPELFDAFNQGLFEVEHREPLNALEGEAILVRYKQSFDAQEGVLIERFMELKGEIGYEEIILSVPEDKNNIEELTTYFNFPPDVTLQIKQDENEQSAYCAFEGKQYLLRIKLPGNEVSFTVSVIH